MAGFEKLALEVPSAVLPYASNVLINPRHRLAVKVAVVDEAAFVFDSRL